MPPINLCENSAGGSNRRPKSVSPCTFEDDGARRKILFLYCYWYLTRFEWRACLATWLSRLELDFRLISLRLSNRWPICPHGILTSTRSFKIESTCGPSSAGDDSPGSAGRGSSCRTSKQVIPPASANS